MLFSKPPLTLLTLLLTTADLTLSTSSPSPSQLSNRSKKFSIGIVLFPGFEPLDVIGPFEILQSVSAYYPQTISFIASQTGPITSRCPPHVMVPGQPPVNLDHLISVSLTATHTFATAPPLDILLIPGGMGNMVLVENNDTSIESFINSRYKSLSYLLSFGNNVKWVPAARWTQDGKIWTSSGVAAGMDMTYAFLSKVYGRVGVVDNVMNAIEYAPHTDPKWDPFSVVWDVPGADPKRSLESCVKPVGF
ncbi:hypothetical protein TWF173_004768 [Orbilia oligospora]|nr:hypothetical protein TWF173_004768 [Orbilia oligospora]